MADFKTHMTVGTATGALLSFAGYQRALTGIPVLWQASCAASAACCRTWTGLGGPLREATAMGRRGPYVDGGSFAAIAAQSRLDGTDCHRGLYYYPVLFSEMFRRYTVHRGMWHSLPAAAICGMLAFLIMHFNEDIGIRCFRAAPWYWASLAI